MTALNRTAALVLLWGLVLAARPARAQGYDDQDSRAEDIFEVAIDIAWPNEQAIERFEIGVLDQGDRVYRELALLCGFYNIHWKPALATHYTSTEQIGYPQILFVGPGNAFDMDRVLERTRGKNILLITENDDFEHSMVNFVDVNGQRLFEVNELRLREAGLTASEHFLANAFKGIDDWKDLYKEVEDRLASEQARVLGLQAEIALKQDSLENTQVLLGLQSTALYEQNRQIKVQRDNLARLLAEVAQQRGLLDSQTLALGAKEELLLKKGYEVAVQEEILLNHTRSIQMQEDRIQAQQVTLDEQMLRLERQRNAILLFVALFGLILVLIFFVLRGYRLKKRANEELQRQQAKIEAQKNKLQETNLELHKLSIVTEKTENAVLIFDRDGRWEWANHGFQRITGLTATDFFAREGTRDLFELSALKDPEGKAQEALRQRKSLVYTSSLLDRDGLRVWLQNTLTPIADEAGGLGKIVVVSTDITQLKRAQEAIELQKEELDMARLEAEKANRAKSEFLANMSHEIRTPMNAVIGFSDLLSNMVADPLQKSYVDSIRSSGKSLLILINDILDLSKIEAGKMELQYEAVNPHSILRELEQIFSVKVKEKGLDLRIVVAPELPESLILDEIRVRQILLNLLGNAVKFTHQGHIRLSVSQTPYPEDISLLDLDIQVQDTGIGISPEDQQSIFESFKQQEGQSTKKYGGTGLGLSITKRLVEMMKGSLTVSSELGKGSIFRVLLRRVSVAATRQPSPTGLPQLPEHFAFAPARVLIVDDITDNRKLIREYFTGTLVQTFQAVNGLDALRKTRELRPDLVLMDIRMPEMDGFQANGILKQDPLTQSIPVIAVTASAMKEEEERIRESGFDGFLMKPVLRKELFNEMARFLPTRPLEEAHQPEPAQVAQSLDLKAWSQVMPLVDAAVTPLWTKAASTNRLKDIKAFAQAALACSQQHGLAFLAEYANRLLFLATSFDIEGISKALKRYPDLLASGADAEP